MCLRNTEASLNLKPRGTHSPALELLMWQFWEQICCLALTHHPPTDPAQIHRSFLLFHSLPLKLQCPGDKNHWGFRQHNGPKLPTITTHYWSGGVILTAGLFCLISGKAVSDINYRWHCRAKFSSPSFIQKCRRLWRYNLICLSLWSTLSASVVCQM